MAFPSVQVGAILDYRYELRFDSIYFLEPWYFSEGVPVRYSEIFFKAPGGLHVQAWSRTPSRVKIQTTKAVTDALGNRTIIKGKPRRGDTFFRPFRATTSLPWLTRGVALGYIIPPLRD